MSEQDNVDILKKGYDLWFESKGEAAEYWMNLIAEDVHWCSVVDENSPGMEFAKDCQNKLEVMQYFQRLGETWEMQSCEVHEYIAQRDRVVVMGVVSWRNRNTEKIVETKKVDVFRLRDGMIVEFCEYYDTAKAIAAST